MAKSLLSSARVRALSIICGVALFAAGCGGQDTRPLTTMSPKGEQAKDIDSLARLIFYVAGVVFVLVLAALVLMIVKFRVKAGQEEGIDEPEQIHGNDKLEVIWTIVPLVLLMGLAVFNVSVILNLENHDEKAMKVEVVGQQWWWEYRYHLDGDWDSDPEIITANQMVIPVDTDIELKIRSNDVIHSFWIPALNGKKDAVPGRSHKLVFHANEEGTFDGQCTEYCGLSHGYMQMEVKAIAAADFATWTDAQTEPAEEPAAGSLAAEGKAEFEAQCAYCHQVNGLAEGSDGTPDPDYQGLGGDVPVALLSQNAPNLTHLMSRERFAGNMFDLKLDNGDLNVAELESWLRAPDEMKPMNNTRPGEVGNRQGMPNLGLDQTTIDKLVAYLQTLK